MLHALCFLKGRNTQMNKLKLFYASIKKIYRGKECAVEMAQANVELFSLLTALFMLYGSIQFIYHTFFLFSKHFSFTDILYLFLYLLLIILTSCIDASIQKYANNIVMRAEDIMDTIDRFCIIFMIGSLFLSLLDIYTRNIYQTQIICCLVLSFLYFRPRKILPTFALSCLLVFIFSAAYRGISFSKINFLLQNFIIMVLIFGFVLYKYYLKNTMENAKKEAKAAKELSIQATSSKTRFLSNVSHSLELPIQRIRESSQFANKEPDNIEDISRELKEIYTSSEELSSFINNITELNAIQHNKTSLTLAPHSIESLFLSLEDIFSVICSHHHQKMIFDIHDIRHDFVLMDYKHIKQLFFNLLFNSVLYTTEGGHIHVTVREMEDMSGEIPKYLFIIEDNGIGMTDEFIDRIFYPFERADDLVLNEVYGTGLGMTIVKHIIDLMNGDIDIASIPNVGTEITITLNLEIAEAEN